MTSMAGRPFSSTALYISSAWLGSTTCAHTRHTEKCIRFRHGVAEAETEQEREETLAL